MKNIFSSTFLSTAFLAETNAATVQTAALICQGLDLNSVLDPNNKGFVSKPISQTPGWVAAGFSTFYKVSSIPYILFSKVGCALITKFTDRSTTDLGSVLDCFYTDITG